MNGESGRPLSPITPTLDLQATLDHFLDDDDDETLREALQAPELWDNIFAGEFVLRDQILTQLYGGIVNSTKSQSI